MQNSLPFDLPVNVTHFPVTPKNYRPDPAEEKTLGALSILPPEQRRDIMKLPPLMRREAIKSLQEAYKKRLYMRNYMRNYKRRKPELTKN